MPHELTDEQYRALMEDHQVASIARQLWDDPQLGQEAKALFKKKHPNASVPDHDIRTEIRSEFAERDRKQQEQREAERIANEDKYWKEKRSQAQKDHNLTDEGMKELEKLMYEKNIGDYDVAATYVAAKNPKPSDPYNQPGFKDPYWNHGKSDTFKEIAKDPEEWGRNEILKALHNDQQRQRGGF